MLIYYNPQDTQVLRAVNKTMVITYFEIGRMIVEEEQNIERMRSFYLVYRKSSTLLRKSNFPIEKQQTLSDEFELSWSHYLTLMRIDNENERKFYEIESVKNNWSVHELKQETIFIYYSSKLKYIFVTKNLMLNLQPYFKRPIDY